MKTTNLIMKLCATLCLIAGLAAFSAGCGDDNNNGNGSDCPEGEVLASVSDGPEQCYEACTEDTDCSEAGASCNSGVCIGGSGNNNNDTDAGNNDSDSGDSLQCAEGELAANPFGEGEACYATCASTDECAGDREECVELTSGDMICVELPTGDATCSDILNCQSGCAQGDSACVQNCYFSGSADAQDTMDALNQCYSDNCGQSQDPACLRNNCQAEVTACAGCTADEIELNFQCATPCENDGECGGQETCVQPYLGLSDQSVCSYLPENLGGGCTGNGECGAPDPEDAAQGRGFCLINQGETAGQCLAVGCNAASAYGPATGCGLEGYCFSQEDETGTITYCRRVCRQQSDCPGNDTGEFACRIAQDTANGGRFGLCEPACSTDADCQFNSTSGPIQGQCNDIGYCELPCQGDGSDCRTAGGTCDANNFCVFETTAAN